MHSIDLPKRQGRRKFSDEEFDELFAGKGHKSEEAVQTFAKDTSSTSVVVKESASSNVLLSNDVGLIQQLFVKDQCSSNIAGNEVVHQLFVKELNSANVILDPNSAATLMPLGLSE